MDHIFPRKARDIVRQYVSRFYCGTDYERIMNNAHDYMVDDTRVNSNTPNVCPACIRVFRTHGILMPIDVYPLQ